MLIRLLLRQQAVGLQQLDQLLACLVAIEAAQHIGHSVSVDHACMFIDDHRTVQFPIHSVCDVEVICVVGRRDLEYARAKSPLDG